MSYENDFQLMRHHMLEIDNKLEKFYQDAQKLTEGLREKEEKAHLLKQSQPNAEPLSPNARAAQSPKAKTRRMKPSLATTESSCAATLVLEGQPYKRQALKLLNAMNAKWDFENRLEKLEDALDRFGDEVDERATAIENERQRAGTSPADSAQVWRDLMLDEVMPWLRRTLKAMPHRLPVADAAIGIGARSSAKVLRDGFDGALGMLATEGGPWARPLDDTFTPAGDWK